MTTTTSRLPAPSRRRDLVMLAALAVLHAAAIVPVAGALRVPPHIDRVTIVNPHPWPATVSATRTGHTNTWSPVGTVDRDTTQSFLEVVDQGNDWTIRFDHLGHHVEVQTTRTHLVRDGWRITVPDLFATQLHAAHVRETAP
jgi:hypothetical protein